MTETVLSPDMLALLKPEHVSPLVTYLAHDSTQVTGQTFEVGGGWYSQVRLQRSAGAFLPSDDSSVATAESIQQNISIIRDFRNDATYPSSPADSFRALTIARGKHCLS
jgi:multifunctional beta-oxidation protein